MSDRESLPDPNNVDGPPPANSRGRDPKADAVLISITRETVARVFGWIRLALKWATMSYVIALLMISIGLEWWAERNWGLSILLYAPPQSLLLPLVVLTPLCAIFRARLIAWHVGAVVFVGFCFMTFRWSANHEAKGPVVTAVTFNSGESNRVQFREFLEREKPDLVILQDARHRGPELTAVLPGSTLAKIGEFAFVSKYPLAEPKFIQGVMWNQRPVAARCEILIDGRNCAVYSVHLPTPRRELSRFLGGRRILGDLVGRSRREAGFGNYREWLAARIELAQGLARIFETEKLPMIVAGDFNTPDHGYVYHLFAGVMTDAFTKAGRGWGLTFPGTTRNPITFFGPWLRLDFFFVDKRWKVLECRPEPGSKSQHKAVLTRIEPQN